MRKSRDAGAGSKAGGKKHGSAAAGGGAGADDDMTTVPPGYAAQPTMELMPTHLIQVSSNRCVVTVSY